MSQPYAAGALCSTLADLTRWNRALHTGHIVSATSYALMTTPEGAAAKSAPHYGNAWVPSAQLSVTVLTNAGGAHADDLLKQLVGQSANPLLYLGDHTFGMSFDPSLRLIFTVEGTKAIKVTLLQGGGRFEGTRK